MHGQCWCGMEVDAVQTCKNIPKQIVTITLYVNVVMAHCTQFQKRNEISWPENVLWYPNKQYGERKWTAQCHWLLCNVPIDSVYRNG